MRAGGSGLRKPPTRNARGLAGALAAAQSVVTAEIAERAMAAGITGQKVGELIHAARVTAVAAWLDTTQQRPPIEDIDSGNARSSTG
jgi:tRNA nucleotidyltransferase (CCA-adding enzyme)